jgi:HD-like signal output (HDOD) protein/CheY-like chemotaxis protein
MVQPVALDQRPSVLFVDDEEAILSSLRSLFRREGYQLFFFSRGTEAIEFIKTHPIDVIVSDMRMPVVSGIEFLNQAALLSPEAARIILSGYEDKSVVLKSLSKGLAHQYFLKPWNDEGFRSIIRQAIEMRSELRRNELKNIHNTLMALPAAPRFHEKLHALLTNDDKYLREIILEIEKSPPIVVKLLRVANSVFFGARKNITSVNDAVRFIGLEYVASLVVAVEAFYAIFAKSNGELVELMEEVWSESVRRATLAKQIAALEGEKKISYTVYTASLLQDIGRVVRMCINPAEYKRYRALCMMKSFDEYDIESRIFSVTHDDLGALLLELWNFPPVITTAVKRHHRAVNDDVIVRILQIATVLNREDAVVRHDAAIDPLIEKYRLALPTRANEDQYLKETP